MNERSTRDWIATTGEWTGRDSVLSVRQSGDVIGMPKYFGVSASTEMQITISRPLSTVKTAC